MGDLDIDVSEIADIYDIRQAYIDEAVEKLRRAEMKSSGANMAKKKAGFEEVGGFRVFKATNGYIVQVGTHEGSIPTDAYVCKEANEIGNLITAHIVGKALED